MALPKITNNRSDGEKVPWLWKKNKAQGDDVCQSTHSPQSNCSKFLSASLTAWPLLLQATNLPFPPQVIGAISSSVVSKMLSIFPLIFSKATRSSVTWNARLINPTLVHLWTHSDNSAFHSSRTPSEAVSKTPFLTTTRVQLSPKPAWTLFSAFNIKFKTSHARRVRVFPVGWVTV